MIMCHILVALWHISSEPAPAATDTKIAKTQRESQTCNSSRPSYQAHLSRTRPLLQTGVTYILYILLSHTETVNVI